MDEADFVSLCTTNSYYCSQRQQREALNRSSRHPLSSTTSSYIHLFVQSELHSAAVQISINPFSLDKYAKQTFFASEYRYSPCCSKAPRDVVAAAVREKVQQVSDTLYQPGRWDFSHAQYVTVDSFNAASSGISKESCLRQTASRLCEYLKSTSAVGRILNDQGGSSSSSKLVLGPESSERRTTDLCPAEDGVRQPELGPECSERRTTDVYPRPDHTQNRKDLPLVSDKCNGDIAQGGRPANEETQILVANAVTKIRRGLENLGKKTAAVPELLNDQRSYSDKAKYYEDYLWAQAARTGAVLQEATWYHRFLASCFGLIRVALETKKGDENSHEDDKPDRTRRTWQIAAEIVNSVVNGLLNDWGWKAYLIYPALECTGFTFSSGSRLALDKREDFVSCLIEALRKEVPSVANQQYLFDPAYLASCALDMDYGDVCGKLKLGNALIVEMNTEKASWAMQHSVMRGCVFTTGKREVALASISCAATTKDNIGSTSSSKTCGTAMPQHLPDGRREQESRTPCSRVSLTTRFVEHGNPSNSRPDNIACSSKKRKADNESEPNIRISRDGIQNIHQRLIESLSAPTMERDNIAPFNPSSHIFMNSVGQRGIFSHEQDLCGTSLNLGPDLVSAPALEHNNPGDLGLMLRQRSTLNLDEGTGIFAHEQDLWGHNASMNLDNATSENMENQGGLFNFDTALHSISAHDWDTNPLSNVVQPASIFGREKDWLSVPITNLASPDGIFSQERDLTGQFQFGHVS